MNCNWIIVYRKNNSYKNHGVGELWGYSNIDWILVNISGLLLIFSCDNDIVVVENFYSWAICDVCGEVSWLSARYFQIAWHNICIMYMYMSVYVYICICVYVYVLSMSVFISIFIPIPIPTVIALSICIPTARFSYRYRKRKYDIMIKIIKSSLWV